MINVKTLKTITGEWYLYHHYKNENALIYVIIFSFLGMFLKEGIVLNIMLWGWYYFYCKSNNNRLNYDPGILKERAAWMKIREEQGVIEEYKKVLGIK